MHTSTKSVVLSFNIRGKPQSVKHGKWAWSPLCTLALQRCWPVPPFSGSRWWRVCGHSTMQNDEWQNFRKLSTISAITTLTCTVIQHQLNGSSHVAIYVSAVTVMIYAYGKFMVTIISLHANITTVLTCTAIQCKQKSVAMLTMQKRWKMENVEHGIGVFTSQPQSQWHPIWCNTDGTDTLPNPHNQPWRSTDDLIWPHS